jgi:GrpB-like predicted nucleotidyltransferase (UPF0157 family)
MKKLASLSQHELDQLFPIILEEHNEQWSDNYEKESKLLWENLDVDVFRIHHIGSTSIKGLLAKPTIDILVEVGMNASSEAIIESMKKIGYLYLPKPESPAPHMMFIKGYTENGFEGQAYHVHVRYPGDWDELYFCEYLSQKKALQEDYANLKQSLYRMYKNDREAYTKGKTTFINEVTQHARQSLYPKYEVAVSKINWKNIV